MSSTKTQTIDLGMVRVSSFKQGLSGDSPDEQKEAIQAKRKRDGREHIQIEWIEVIDSGSGEDQPFQKVIDFYKNNPQYKVVNTYVKVLDRMTRGGAKPYIHFKDILDAKGIQLIDVAGVVDPKTVNTLEHITKKKYRWSVYNPSFKNEILQAEADRDEVRKILTRLIGAEIRYTQFGYWNGPPPLGYKNKKIDTPEHGKRTVLEADEKESPWFETMFTLQAQGATDSEIVKQVNAMGFKTRPRNIYDKEIKNKIMGRHPGEPLTIKSLQEYIKRPIYAGVNTHEYLEGKPIKARFKGILSIDKFNQANKGKITIVEDGEAVRIYRGKVPSYMLKKDKFNSTFPYKDQVMCPKCKEEFYASTSKGGHGGYYSAYHHGSKNGKHKYFKIPSDDFHTTIEEFVKLVKFTDEFLMYLHKYILEEWDTRRTNTLDKNIVLGQRLTAIEQEQKMYAEKIPTLNSPTTIKIFEDKIEALEQDKIGVMAEKAKKQKEGLDIQKIINYSWYFFEHLEDLLLGGTDKRLNATLFGLIFDEKPTYENLILRTARLSCVFKLSEAHKNTLGSKNMNSEPGGDRTHDQELKRLLLYR